MSSTASMPAQKRTRPSLIPIRWRFLGAISRCEEMAGYEQQAVNVAQRSPTHHQFQLVPRSGIRLLSWRP